jgi:hypothetical protein
MEKIFTASILVFFITFIHPIVTTFFGALGAWTIGIFFEDTIRETLGALGLNVPVTMWQMGATLGFLGGFFKSINTGQK